MALVRAFGWLLDNLGAIYLVAMAAIVAASLLLLAGIAVAAIV